MSVLRFLEEDPLFTVPATATGSGPSLLDAAVAPTVLAPAVAPDAVEAAAETGDGISTVPVVDVDDAVDARRLPAFPPDGFWNHVHTAVYEHGVSVAIRPDCAFRLTHPRTKGAE